MKLTLRLIAVIALLLAGPLALAQAWPTKPIRIINPFPAGGGTDTFARPLAAKLTQSLGQTVIIENQGGAGGTVGAANAARTNPDGYTFLMGAIHHTIAESLYPKLSYNIEKDFIPITMVAQVPQVMVVHPKHPFRTLKELVDYAKANPGKLNFGSPGAGTSHHLAMELFMRVTGTNFVHVPYRGAGPMMQDFLAGQIDLVFDGPTMEESGVAGMVINTWYALWAVKDTPRELVDRMQQESAKAMSLPDMKEIWASQLAESGGNTPEQFKAFVRSEVIRWSKVVKDANVVLN
ncbi:MAG: tripartite tricarboxylate transporter substrate-binding protein [Burkholderiales bacterium]|nr:tripartite tricarboxylate transporter substrate-binding protein [Burkholderiales bacterium]